MDDVVRTMLGDQVADSLDVWARHRHLTLRLDRTGRGLPPGSWSVAVTDQVQAATEQYVIRLLDAAHRDEFRRHNEALHDANGFGAAHLVQLAPADRNMVQLPDGGLLVFHRPAGPDVAQIETLAGLSRAGSDRTAVVSACDAVVTGVLHEWAGAPRAVPMPIGRLLDLHFPGQRQWRTVAAVLGAGRSEAALLGRAHGDLRQQNVLLPSRSCADTGSYRLTGLLGYSASAPLTRDPVHLVLDVVVGAFEELSESQRADMLDVLADLGSDRVRYLPEWLEQVVAVLKRAEEWTYPRSLLVEWRAQIRLSTVACALALAGSPGVADAARAWLHRLAVDVAKRYAGDGIAVERLPAAVGGRAPHESPVPAEDWRARFCRQLPDLRRRAKDRGLRDELRRVEHAARIGDASAAAFGELAEQVGSVQPPAVPGVSGDAYRCPSEHDCHRIERYDPEQWEPRCHLENHPMLRARGQR